MFLPESMRQAWIDRDGPVVLATVDPNSCPNIIYATCVSEFGDDRIVVADNYFHKTRKNLIHGGKGALLFRSRDGKAYQVKGQLEYHTDGEIFNHMKSWNPSHHPGHAAAVLRIEEIFSGAEKLFPIS